MKKLNKLIFLLVTIINVVRARSSTSQIITTTERYAHISPEIINDLKDFKNLIPESTVDEIIGKHYLLDNSFRTALKYLRSNEFNQLQQQLLNIPEIINILEFLHLTTTANATTRHMGATKIPTIAARVKASLDEYNGDDAAAAAVADSDKVTTKAGTIISKLNTIATENVKESMSNTKKSPKQPQPLFHKNIAAADDDDAAENTNSHARLSSEEQTSVHIVLLEALEVKAGIHNLEHNNNKHHYKYRRQYNNHYHRSLGTFTTFVEEVLQHLPHTAFQTMIKDKCKKNPQFAQFYQALRSQDFKSVIEQAKSTANITKLIQTLGSHEVDVNSLEPIAFLVISWGPDV